ncbi:MAG TPA: hypothetical protein VGO93_10810 [Candidatus Xenobia bacterium]|jgi:hypothetical protein
MKWILFLLMLAVPACADPLAIERTWFNQHADSVRVLALMSPT